MRIFFTHPVGGLRLGQLTNGMAMVRLEPDFIQTVNTEMDYKSLLPVCEKTNCTVISSA